MTIRLRCERDYHGPQWPNARVGQERDFEPYQVEQLLRDLPSGFKPVLNVKVVNPDENQPDASDQADSDEQSDSASAEGAPAEAETAEPQALETPKGRGRRKAAAED